MSKDKQKNIDNIKKIVNPALNSTEKERFPNTHLIVEKKDGFPYATRQWHSNWVHLEN